MTDRQRTVAIRAQAGQRRDGIEHAVGTSRRRGRMASPTTLAAILQRDERAKALDRPRRPPP